MKNILIILGVFVFSFFSFLPTTQSQPSKSSWNYYESKDKMTGKIDQRYIVTYFPHKKVSGFPDFSDSRNDQFRGWGTTLPQ